jgi:hypothetical protein
MAVGVLPSGIVHAAAGARPGGSNVGAAMKRVFVALTVVVALVTIATVLPPDAVATDLTDRFGAPSLAHPLGTDHLGRDVLARLVDGARISVGITAVALAVCAVLGTWPDQRPRSRAPTSVGQEDGRAVSAPHPLAPDVPCRPPSSLIRPRSSAHSLEPAPSP